MEKKADNMEPIAIDTSGKYQVNLILKEAEVAKVNAQPGDVLIFKLKGDEFTEYDAGELGAHLRKLFPQNKVAVLALPEGHDMELTILQIQDKLKEDKDCSAPTSYCSDCNCGKKERLEGK